MSQNRAKIRCVTYGGPAGWFLRKTMSGLTSRLYLEAQYCLRKRLYKRYMKHFAQAEAQGTLLMPCLISIETINRCNSACEFCPANRNAETRPFCRMEEELFHKLIRELKELNYSVYLNLYVNNEPFMDTRIEEWYRYAREQLPFAKMLLYTNGTLLTLERFTKIIPCIDKMIINNYSDTLKLHKNICRLYKFVRDNKAYWDKDITIQIRYIREILTNRAGTAPNKRKKKRSRKICIMPFTDITVYPDGRAGICCNDALEKTNYGNLHEHTLLEIWDSGAYRQLRNALRFGREQYPFCRGCDFVDAGIRNQFIKEALCKRQRQPPENGWNSNCLNGYKTSTEENKTNDNTGKNS